MVAPGGALEILALLTSAWASAPPPRQDCLTQETPGSLWLLSGVIHSLWVLPFQCSGSLADAWSWAALLPSLLNYVPSWPPSPSHPGPRPHGPGSIALD